MKKETVNAGKKAIWYSILRIFAKILIWFGKETFNLFYLLCFESTKARKTSDIDQDVYLKKNSLFKLVVINPSERTSQPESKS
jgi:hypothetical protein